MERKRKVIVVHPDKQHSFMTAKAVKDMGMLDKYITTVYDKKCSFTGLLTRFVKGTFGKKLKAHKTDLLEDSEVKLYSEFLSLCLFILVRIDKSKKIFTKIKILRDRAFNKKVASYIRKNNIDVVVSFDTLSADLYQQIEKKSLKTIKIIDMSAPYFPYMNDIFAKEAKQAGENSKLNEKGNKFLFDHWIEQSKIEIKKADAYLAASDFTATSLTEYGAEPGRIYKCIYGMNTGFFNGDLRKFDEKEDFKCIYVGNITEQKGCRYLFDVIKRSASDNIGFTLVGACDANVESNLSNCNFTGYILHGELKKRLLESDVMIFPSLADGFGFAVLEAMACGVVPICSKNAGVSSVIDEGESGFIISPDDTAEAYCKLIWLKNNKNELKRMSLNAINKAKSMTWENYYSDVQNALKSVLKLNP